MKICLFGSGPTTESCSRRCSAPVLYCAIRPPPTRTMSSSPSGAPGAAPAPSPGAPGAAPAPSSGAPPPDPGAPVLSVPPDPGAPRPVSVPPAPGPPVPGQQAPVSVPPAPGPPPVHQTHQRRRSLAQDQEPRLTSEPPAPRDGPAERDRPEERDPRRPVERNERDSREDTGATRRTRSRSDEEDTTSDKDGESFRESVIRSLNEMLEDPDPHAAWRRRSLQAALEAERHRQARLRHLQTLQDPGAPPPPAVTVTVSPAPPAPAGTIAAHYPPVAGPGISTVSGPSISPSIRPAPPPPCTQHRVMRKQCVMAAG